MSDLDILRKIVADCQAQKVTININGKNRKVLIDTFSANVALKVRDSVNDANREKLDQMPIHKMINVCMSAYATAAA